MKIGLLLTVYNCYDYIEDCLNPWFSLKERYNIVISANSGMFSDYYKLGIPFRNNKTLEILYKYDIDFLIATKGKNLLAEDQSRNLCLNFLNSQNCDIIWVIDGDEVYTVDQIINIIDFIENNPQGDWYEVYFKNLTIKKNLFMEYKHGRIMWTNRYGGISYFYFDNRFIYVDPDGCKKMQILTIPKNVAFIKHNSWISNDSRTKDKLIYQNYRYRYFYKDGENIEIPEQQRCSYVWDDEKDQLKFNNKYYESHNIDIPCLHEEVSCFTTDFTINFSRIENSFKIVNVYRDIDSTFEIYGDNDILIYSTQLKLLTGINYFINPSYIAMSDENFYNFHIKVYENRILIHDEKIYLRLR